MNEDHRRSGQCKNFMIAKKPLHTPRLSLMLNKSSPYTDLISKGYASIVL